MAHSKSRHQNYYWAVLLSLLLTACSSIHQNSTHTASAANSALVDIYAINEQGPSHKIGTVLIKQNQYGSVTLTPNIKHLTPGFHGFHVHQNPSCEAKIVDGKAKAGLAAGGHFDPEQTHTHAGPWSTGHLGDLPALYANKQGIVSTKPLFAPRLSLEALRGRALIIHAQGDNYSDKPKALGGGGARIACGVIK